MVTEREKNIFEEF